MIYTISIGSNKHRKDNLALARRRLSELFPDICFSVEEETEPLFLHHSYLFSNQVARFVSDCQAKEIISLLKAIEREAGRTAEEKNRKSSAWILIYFHVIL